MGSVELTVTELPDGMVGVTGAWPLGGGRYLRHAVRAQDVWQATKKLEEWYARRQAETEAAS